MAGNYDDDFVEGIKAAAKWRYWRRHYWDLTEQEVVQLLAERTWPKWQQLKLKPDANGRRDQASYLAYKVRSSVVAYADQFHRRLGVVRAR